MSVPMRGASYAVAGAAVIPGCAEGDAARGGQDGAAVLHRVGPLAEFGDRVQYRHGGGDGVAAVLRNPEAGLFQGHAEHRF
ncbi:hypothetical protein ACH4TC_34925 [Streptomyces spororaveus]|uniref:hypothetical protein n=1 Tax=Streptomyces spororaveus TaxID=284039 RepID=UPI003787FEC1